MTGTLAKLAAAVTRSSDAKQVPFIERRSEPRLWCSDLVHVSLKQNGRWKRVGVGILEDISPSGACVQVDDPVVKGSQIRIQADQWKVEGEVRYCVYREIGYYIGVHLDENSKWSKEMFRPKHLMDPSKVATRKRTKGDSNK